MTCEVVEVWESDQFDRYRLTRTVYTFSDRYVFTLYEKTPSIVSRWVTKRQGIKGREERTYITELKRKLSRFTIVSETKTRVPHSRKTF